MKANACPNVIEARRNDFGDVRRLSTPHGGGCDLVDGTPSRRCRTPDPDEAIRTAIKAAVDAGQWKRAPRLLSILKGPDVVDLAARRRG